MTDQIVLTEKTSQAKDVRAAVGLRYGVILPAEGHLLDLLEPEDVVPESPLSSPQAIPQQSAPPAPPPLGRDQPPPVLYPR